MPAAPVPPSAESTAVSASAASHPPDSPPTSNLPPSSAPYALLIGAAAFAHASKLPGAMNFTLYICTEDAKLCSAAASPPVDTPNMAGVPAASMTLLMSSAKPRPPHLLHITSMTSTLTWKKARALRWVLCTLSHRLS